MPMVDVTAKPVVLRDASARAIVRMSAATLRRIRRGTVPKGDVLGAARAAGMLAAKSTPHLLPLCHPVALTGGEIDFRLAPRSIEVTARMRAADRTGVEMEALLAAAAAALCVWDCCKGIDADLSIGAIRLLSKSKRPL